MATIDLVIRAVNKATAPLQAIADSATEAADRIDALNDRIDTVNRSLNAAAASAEIAESGMRSAGREAEVLAGKLSVLNDRLDDLDRTVTAKVRVDVDKSGLGGAGRAGGGLLGGLFGAGSSGISGLLAALPGPLSNPYVAGGAAAAILAALPFAATAISGSLVGTAGAGLAGLGIYGALQSQLPATLTTAQGNYTAASANLVTAIRTSPADLKAYQSVLQGLEPDLARAAVLLTNQNIVWQNLTPSQQAAEVALRNNSAAYKTLLPDQKNALSALLKQQAAWDALTPAQQKAARATQGMQDSLGRLEGAASDALTKIGAPFVGTLTAIFNAADRLIARMTPVFVQVEKVIAAPLQTIGTTLVNSFAQPAVVNSIRDIGAAFAQFLRAFAPQIPGIVKALADGVDAMALAFTSHPGMISAMSSVLAFLLRLPGYAFDALAALTRVADWISTGFPHEVSRGLDYVREQYVQFGHDTEHDFDVLRSVIANVWNATWANTISRAANGVADVERWLGSMPGRIRAVLGKAGTVLYNWGAGVIQGLLNGFHAVWGAVQHFFTSLPSRVLGWLGIHSPPQWAIDAGQHIMNGIGIGLGRAQGAVSNAMGTVAGTIANAMGAINLGGGVTQWITAAMRDTMAPASWLPALQRLVALESGGNPFAVNPQTAGSSGEHAAGIAQTIPATYATFATVPGGIFNPVSDLVAAIRYIMSTYGSPFNIPGLMSGVYHGYASGGIIAEPVLGVGLRSGSRYGFGENGAETVVPGVGHVTTGARHDGPLFTIAGDLVVHDEADAAIVAQRLSGMIRMAGLGLGGGFRH